MNPAIRSNVRLRLFQSSRFGGATPLRSDAAASLPDHHQALGLGEWKRTEQRRVDQREDGAVGADAERQCDRRDERESRRASQLPNRELHIVTKFFEPLREAHVTISLFARTRRDKVGNHFRVPALPGHAQRGPPLAATAPGIPLHPNPCVDVRAARHEKLDDGKLAAAARLDKRVLIPWNHRIYTGATVKEELDNRRVPLSGRHNQRIAIPGHRHIGVSAVIQQKSHSVQMALARRPD